MLPQRWALAVPLGLMLLAGCESPPNHVELLVNTMPSGAACQLSRAGQPIATAQPTPAIALVDPGGGEITVQCRRPGFADAVATVPIAASSSWGFGYFEHSAARVGYESRVDIAMVPTRP